MTLKQYPWPVVPPFNQSPKWNGSTFILNEKCTRVISYDVNSSHWSESLTSMHEDFSGRDHPIERISRNWALKSMKLAALKSIIMDVGCSSGFFIDDLKVKLPESEIIAADYIIGPLLSLANRTSNFPILQFDLRNCPLPDDSIDAITCLNVLEHIDDDKKALSEIFRILKKDGIVHMEVPAGAKLYDIYDEHLMHHRRYSQRQLIKLAQSVGFKVLYTTHLGFLAYPAFWFIKKKNQKLVSLTENERFNRVSRQINKTHKSILLNIIFKTEFILSKFIRFPVGIRVIAVLRK